MKSASSRSEKQASASRKPTSMKSKTDWARLKSDVADVKLTPEHPEADLKHVVRGTARTRQGLAIRMPTQDEDKAITAAIKSDPDA